MTRLWVVPLELDEANTIMQTMHRHHDGLPVHRFSIGAVDSVGVIHGAAICGRPAARTLSSRDVLEVSRLCTDGTPNACSILYAAAARSATAIGYRRVQTYILDTETGTSLVAAGWRFDGNTDPITATHHNWANRPGRKDTPHLYGAKGRWVKDLPWRPNITGWPSPVTAAAEPTLFDAYP
jgi:hypothetical protein